MYEEILVRISPQLVTDHRTSWVGDRIELLVIPSHNLLRRKIASLPCECVFVCVCMWVHFSILRKILRKLSHVCFTNFVHFKSMVRGQILFISKKFILLNIHQNVVKVKIERKASFSNNYYYQHEHKKTTIIIFSPWYHTSIETLTNYL